MVFRRLCDLDVPPGGEDDTYTCELVFLVVSVRFRSREAPLSRFYITDFTQNPKIEIKFARENYIRNHTERIDRKKILQLNVPFRQCDEFVEKVGKVRKNNEFYKKLVVNSTEHVLPLGIFARSKVKISNYKGIIVGDSLEIELLDKSLGNIGDYALYKDVLTELPEDFLAYNAVNYERVLNLKPDVDTDEELSQLVDKQEASNNPFILSDVPSTPIFKDSSPQRLSLPPDTVHSDDFEDDSALTKRIKYNNYIFKLNSNLENDIDEINGELYEFYGYIININPTFNELCVKLDKNSSVQLNPISLVIVDNLSNKVINEMNYITVNVETRDELLKFYQYDEVEEVYLNSNKLFSKLRNVIKSKKLIHFKIIRELSKRNVNGLSMFVWKFIDLTINDL